MDAKPEKATPVQGGNRATDPLTLSRRVRLIAWCQLVAAVMILLNGVELLWSLRGSLFWFWMPMFVLVVGANAIAGIQTLRRRRVGYWLSIWNHVAQIPSVAVPGFTFNYIGLGGVVVYLRLQTLAIDNQLLWDIGIEAEFNPGFNVIFGATPEPYGVSIDLLAISFVAVLLSALRLNKTGGTVVTRTNSGAFPVPEKTSTAGSLQAGETKVCPTCQKQIPSTALMCKFCQACFNMSQPARV